MLKQNLLAESGATGSVVNMEEIEEGDEVRAFFRVRGNKVKEVTGVVSEISQKGYVRLRTKKNLKEIKPRHHLQLLKTFPKTTPKQSRRRTFMCESGP